MPPSTTVAVRAEGVSKRWGTTQALREATFTIGSGVTGLLGANGAGKTTMLGLILGMHQPESGSMEVLGHDPWTHGAEIRARIGYAPEHDCLAEDVRAQDAVRHIAEIHGLPGREAQTRASDALWEVGLGEERFRPVGTMSTGQRQRVKLALAIAHDPQLVLLDEPTNGLDPMQREHMLDLIRHVGHNLGLDIVLSSHLLDEVERVSDGVVIIHEGEVVRSGSLGDLRNAGDTDMLDVAVDGEGNAEKLVRALGDRGVAAEIVNGSVAMALDGDEIYDVVRDCLAELGVPVRRLGRRSASLEQVFLEASGG